MSRLHDDGSAVPAVGGSQQRLRPGGGCAERGGRVRAGHRDVHGAGRPDGDAHVHHLQRYRAQHLRREEHWRPPGEDRAAGLQRGRWSGLSLDPHPLFNSSITVLNILHVAGLVLTMQGLAILKASLKSKSVLTDVFLHANNN